MRSSKQFKTQKKAIKKALNDNPNKKLTISNVPTYRTSKWTGGYKGQTGKKVTVKATKPTKMAAAKGGAGVVGSVGFGVAGLAAHAKGHHKVGIGLHAAGIGSAIGGVKAQRGHMNKTHASRSNKSMSFNQVMTNARTSTTVGTKPGGRVGRRRS